MPYVVAEPCIGTKDKSCVAVCPVECFYEGEDQLYIHPDECIDCGLCVPECPVDAIFADVSFLSHFVLGNFHRIACGNIDKRHGYIIAINCVS